MLDAAVNRDSLCLLEDEKAGLKREAQSTGWSQQLQMKKTLKGSLDKVFPLVTKPTASTDASPCFNKFNFFLD